MDFDWCRKPLAATRRDWSRYSSLACVDIMSAQNFLKTGAVEEGNRKGERRKNLPLIGTPPSGLLARLPVKPRFPIAVGLPTLDPWGVPVCEEVGGLSFNFFVFPLSLISPPEAAPPSTSLVDPAPPPGTFLTRFFPAYRDKVNGLPQPIGYFLVKTYRCRRWCGGGMRTRIRLRCRLLS